MVRLVPVKDVRHVADRALRALVVLAGARRPRARVPDVDLARGVVEAEETAGQDRHEVLLVVDVCDAEPEGVDVVREVLISDAREAVPDEAHGGGGDLQVEVDRVEERDGRAWKTVPAISLCFRCAAGEGTHRGSVPLL